MKIGILPILGVVLVLVGLLWYWTRQRNTELFQSGITLKNITCTAEMPERTYNPAPIPASTSIPNIRIDIMPYIKGDGDTKWKIDLATIVNFYAPNAGSVRSEDQTALYNERLVPLYTYRNITYNLFNSRNIVCWRDYTRVMLYLMNCNSMIIPFMTKAATISNLTDEVARRNNFKELLKEPKYSFLNAANPFGIEVYNSPYNYFIYRSQDLTNTYDDCLSTSNAIRSKNSSVLAAEVHQGNFEGCHVVFRWLAQLLLMRVNISELTEADWHKDLDEIVSWLDKLAQYLGTRFRDNNIHLIRTIPMMMGALLSCRKLTVFATELEKFFDTAFSVKEGFIWTETNRDVMVINYHLYFQSMIWIIFIIFQATGTPFPFEKYRTILKKIVDNCVVEVYMQNKIKEKGWTDIQFHDVMASALAGMGIQLVDGSLQGLTSGESSSCFLNPATPCGTPAPALTTVNCNCTMKKITFDFIMNAMDTIKPPTITTTTTTPYFTVGQMKVLLFYTGLGDFAKSNNCPPITLASLNNPRMLDFYKYFYEGGSLPTNFTTDFPMSPNDFVNALKKWVEVERTIP